MFSEKHKGYTLLSVEGGRCNYWLSDVLCKTVNLNTLRVYM